MQLEKTTIVNALAYRGDTRPPEEIFGIGFYNRQKPESQWLQILNGGSEDIALELKIKDVETGHLSKSQMQLLEDPRAEKECDPLAPPKLEYRLWLKSDREIYAVFKLKSVAGIRGDLWAHYIKNRPLYRDEHDDISPKTAVCLTLRGPHVASYFPIGGCTEADGEWIWIYAVSLGAAYTTYTYQQARGSALAQAREVAVEHVANSDVMCAVRCWRKGKYPNMEFLLAPRICWNPTAGGQRLLWKSKILEAFHPYQAMECTCADCRVTKCVKGWARLWREPPYHYWRWQK